MRNRAFGPLGTMLSLLLAACTTVQAGPISISQVVQVLGDGSRAPELRLRNVSQTSSLVADDESMKSSTGSRPPSTKPSSVDLTDTSLGTAPNSSGSLLAGIAVNGDNPQNVDVINQGDLEGSICDCGEIPGAVVKGHFPLWPLLFLAVIPFFFIHHGKTHPTPTPTPPPPTPTPPPQVPEPTSLLLMGSGLAALGAGLRRRYARGKLEKEIASEEA